MSESHVVSGLVAKRSELAGLIDHHQKEIDRLTGDLVHLDAAIKLFSPEFDLGTIKRKQYRRYSRLFKQGECYRLSIDALRNAGGPISTAAITEKIMERKGLKEDQRKTVSDSVNNSLRYAERNGVVMRDGMDGPSLVWKLA